MGPPSTTLACGNPVGNLTAMMKRGIIHVFPSPDVKKTGIKSRFLAKSQTLYDFSCPFLTVKGAIKLTVSGSQQSVMRGI